MNPQHAAVTLWVPCSSISTAPSATPPMGTASANPGWEGPTATGAWWDTGASTTTAAVRVTARETVTRLQGTVCLGECQAGFSLLHPDREKSTGSLWVGFIDPIWTCTT